METRLIAVFSLFTLLAFLLFFRVGALSTAGGLAETAQTQSTYSLRIEHTRGQIYDCRMQPLTGEKRAYIAACLPMPENEKQLLSCRALCPAGGKEALKALISEGRPFLVPCSCGELDIPGVEVFPVTERSGGLARHVVGYLDASGTGVTGIERAYEEILSQFGQDSVISYKVNGARVPLPGVAPQVSLAPVQTDGVVLTIDSRIQEIVEEAGEKLLKKGAVVVMEPSTGKLRAVASFPSYTEESLPQAVTDEENTPLLNRAFLAYNVGSTFKICTAAAALTQGISPAETFSCEGYTEVKGQIFKCHNLQGHGLLDMRGAMEASCNPYFIQLGLQVNRENFLEMAGDLSFGRASSLAPGLSTAAGTLPTAGELVSPAALGNFSFGQGELTATPVQVAQMVSAVVNGGETPAATLVEGFTESGQLVERREQERASTKAMSGWVARLLQSQLVASVMETENQNAKPQYVTAGGKTGTAQTGQMKADGEELLQGWFAGFFPAEEPQYVVVVLAEDARSGNQDASPVFREIADRLNAPIKVELGE